MAILKSQQTSEYTPVPQKAEVFNVKDVYASNPITPACHGINNNTPGSHNTTVHYNHANGDILHTSNSSDNKNCNTVNNFINGDTSGNINKNCDKHTFANSNRNGGQNGRVLNGLNSGAINANIIHNQGYIDAATAQITEGSCKPDERLIASVSTDSGATMEEEEEREYRCGWGPFTPAVCQRFRNAKWICFWLCWAGAIQGMVVNGFVNVVISNIERRYDLSSTTTGTIASCYDIASVLCLIPVSFFGGIGCKPRYLGIGVLIMGIGSFVFALPHFISGSYVIEDSEVSSTCDLFANMTHTSVCDADTKPASLANYRYLFFLGQLLHGAGAAPLYTLGVTYLDENLPLKSSSFYCGIFYALAIIGPAIGYLAGGAFLDIYVDTNTDISSLNLNSSSPRWVGAWWIGFIISGVLAFIIAFPLAGFPKSLPGAEGFKKEREKEVYSKKKKHASDCEVAPIAQDSEGTIGYKKVLKNVKVLLLNPTFMFLNLAAACEGNMLSGIATFMPKFIEYQFAFPASTAAQYVGYAAIPAGGGGTFLGGYLVKKFDLHVRGIIKLCLGLTVTVLGLSLVFLVHCDNIPFAGVNTDYGSIANLSMSGKSLSLALRDQCNSGCDCSQDLYKPVCGVDGLVYFSPCYAGCQSTVPGENNKYSNCSCVVFEGNRSLLEYEAEEGHCVSKCQYLPLLMPICALLIFLTFMASMPALSATLRCIPQDQKSFGLGIQWIIARCLGSIPGPILFGKLIDITCYLWQDRCGEEGSCFSYDNKQMSHNMLAIVMGGKFFSALFFFLAFILYKVPKDDSNDTDDSMSESSADKKDNANNVSSRSPPTDLTLNISRSGTLKSNHSINTAVSMLTPESYPNTPATPNSGNNHTSWSHL